MGSITVLDDEFHLPAHLPMRNKYHLHEAEDLGSTERKKLEINQGRY
jgi:hypothetical protein